jgi:Fe-S cluster assembly protein SufD
MTQSVATAASTAASFVEGLADGIGSIPGEPEAVVALRLEASRAFAAAGVPTSKQEDWRFTNLKALAATPHFAADAATVDIDGWKLGRGQRIVVVNGRYSAELSSLDGLPDGVSVRPLADAIANDPIAAERLGNAVDLERHPFAALNTAHFVDGVFVHLARGAAATEPIHLLFVSAGDDEPAWSAPRTFIVAEPTAEATIVEHYVGTDGETLTVPVTEFQLAAGANVRHCRLQEESRSARHIALQSAHLGRDSRLDSVALNVGGALMRTNLDAVLAESGSHASLDGLYLVEDRQHTDSQITVRHAAPHCTSHELYKGILDGSSRAVFNGRIIVDQDAQKTDAIQSNRNLLLSSGALVNSNPQLEIFADDVRCTHGSTVGRLDDEAVFYLRSRGIDRATAESLLTYAFAAEILGLVPVDEVRERLERHLVARLPQGELAREAF